MNTRADAVGVTMENVVKKYGQTTALRDFGLVVEPGEMVVLLGPSGCGKTTALRCLAGLESVNGGRILVGDRDITHVPVQKREMAMVFQSYSLFPHLNALDNVAFGLRNKKVGKSAARTQAQEALELVGLADQVGKYVHQMSGGQQQRVALARALAVKPQVLLLDEPLSALDAKVRVQLREEIRRIQLDVGMTTLFVTHDQEEALAIADRVGVMHGGRIAQLDAPEKIYNEPNTPFVAKFIGVTNKVRAHSDGTTAQFGDNQLPLLPGSATGEVDVLIRPEHMRLEPTSRANRDATVASVSFLGAFARVNLTTSAGTGIVVQTPAASSSHLSAGDGVHIELTGAPVLAESPEELTTA